MYITYDLEQSGGVDEKNASIIVRGAKEVLIPGPLTRWEVGEFHTASGAVSYGVHLSYVDPKGGAAHEVIEVPANSQNVNVHVDLIPDAYREALKNAA